ncbi:MAG: SH3 domain-containing protein [Clostridia bacterium]|nr:SH3 domain-containing protein [Clostridia bacterium]
MKRTCTVLLALSLLLAMAVSGTSEETMTGVVYVREGGGSLHIRAEESTSSKSLGYVYHNDEIVILRLGQEWSRIFVPKTGLTGCIKTKYITSIRTQAPEAGNTVYIYPSRTDAEIYDLSCSFTVDLDGDGVNEYVSSIINADEYGVEYSSLSIENDLGSSVIYPMDFYDYTVNLCFVSNPTGGAYILISGDEASCDYFTLCLSYNGKQLISNPVMNAPEFETEFYAPGGITGFDNGVITLSGSRDMLGTWYAAYPYIIENGALTAVQDALFRVEVDISDSEIWEYRALKTARPLPAIVYGKLETIPAGVRLILTAFDPALTKAFFVTENGLAGEFIVNFDSNDWSFSISGINEADAFTELHYAG